MTRDEIEQFGVGTPVSVGRRQQGSFECSSRLVPTSDCYQYQHGRLVHRAGVIDSMVRGCVETLLRSRAPYSDCGWNSSVSRVRDFTGARRPGPLADLFPLAVRWRRPDVTLKATEMLLFHLLDNTQRDIVPPAFVLRLNPDTDHFSRK